MAPRQLKLPLVPRCRSHAKAAATMSSMFSYFGFQGTRDFKCAELATKDGASPALRGDIFAAMGWFNCFSKDAKTSNTEAPLP